MVNIIHTDFSKAFDTVNIRLLMSKLSELRLPNSLLKWLLSYLTDRKPMIRFNGCVSKCIDVLSEVPQGSHIGPLLFILFVNDLCEVLDGCKFLFYADDLKIFKAI